MISLNDVFGPFGNRRGGLRVIHGYIGKIQSHIYHRCVPLFVLYATSVLEFSCTSSIRSRPIHTLLKYSPIQEKFSHLLFFLQPQKRRQPRIFLVLSFIPYSAENVPSREGFITVCPLCLTVPPMFFRCSFLVSNSFVYLLSFSSTTRLCSCIISRHF